MPERGLEGHLPAKMGAQMVYLPKPVTTKLGEDGGDLLSDGLHYGVSGMQGWRRNMEDAHLAVEKLDDKISLFGVFDGHGGRGVSRFAAKRLPELLQEEEAYKQGDYARALEMAFLRVDEKLREAAGRQEVEDLDRPDEGAPSQPMAVPRRVLRRFLGADTPAEAKVGNGTAATSARSATNGAAEEAEPPAEEPPTEEATEEAAAEGEGTEEGGPELDGEGEDDFMVQLADEGDEDGEELEVLLEQDQDLSGEDMALVDPSRLTRDPTPEAQGCTAVVVLVVRREGGDGPRLICANAGDSRAVMSRMGQVVALSEDHKPENPGETARITKAGGFVQQMPGGARVQGDLNLSRAMGDLRYKKPDCLPPEEQILTAFPEVRTFSLKEEDEFMVIGCDGIWERIGNQEIVDFVRARLGTKDENDKAVALSQICGEICDQGLCPSMDTSENEGFDGTGCDNMTVVIVQLKKDIGGDSLKRPAKDHDGVQCNGVEGSKRLKVTDVAEEEEGATEQVPGESLPV